MEWQPSGRRRRGSLSEKKLGTSLASWADANGVLPRLAGLVANGEASSRVVDILKKCRGSGAALSKAQQVAMLGQLRGAGPWHKVDAAAAPASNDGPASNRGTRRRAAMAAAPAASPAVPGSPAKKVARAEPKPSEMAVEPDEGWNCTNCTASHHRLPRKCRLCQHLRVPAAVPEAAPAALSVEERAAKRAGLQACISSMQTYGAMPAAIAERQAALAELDKPVAPSPLPGLSEQLAVATAAEAAALAYENALIDKGRDLLEKVAEAQADVAALSIALGKASLQCKVAANKLTAVRRAVGAQDQTAVPAAAAAPAAPAEPLNASILAAVDANFARQLEALRAPEAEVQIRQEMESYASLWGCTLENGFSIARYLAIRAAAVREELANTSTSAPGTARATVVRPAGRPATAPAEGNADGESRLPARDSCKKDAISETSRAQLAKEACALAQRETERQAGLLRKRMEKDGSEAKAGEDDDA